MQTIAFLSNTITKPINRLLKEYKCEYFDIDTITQTLSSNTKVDYLVILLDINYYANDGFLDDSANTKFNELKLLLKLFRKNNKTKIIISNIASNFLDINSSLNIKEYQKLLDINARIEEFVQIGDVAILNIYQLVNYTGYKNFYNAKNSFLFQTPWTKKAFLVIANGIYDKINLFSNIRKKLLILDADNTLWGGIIGEDGIEGIAIDKNYPGIIYRFFQKKLKYLQNSGLLLAIVSKNNLSDVKEVFDNKNMPLSWNDFIIKKVNWHAKSINIREIANELNIGLDSMLFFDDSDFELNEVKDNLGIDGIKISTDNIITNLDLIDSIPVLKSLSISTEDKLKTTQYQAQNKRVVAKNKFNSLDNYLKSIAMKLHYSINQASQIKRIAQLINKTNQFNLTTKRYSETEVLEIIQHHKLFSFSLKDKFGDLGLIAVVIIKDNMIDSFLMSCRVLGRNLEQKILYLVSKHTKLPLQAKYISTAKNQQVSKLYDNFDFEVIKHNKQYTLYNLQKQVKNVTYIEVVNG